jgi:hypothetical protein
MQQPELIELAAVISDVTSDALDRLRAAGADASVLAAFDDFGKLQIEKVLLAMPELTSEEVADNARAWITPSPRELLDHSGWLRLGQGKA